MKVSTNYDAAARTFTLTASQSTPATPGQEHKEPLLIPIAVGLLGSDGERTLHTESYIGLFTLVRTGLCMYTSCSSQGNPPLGFDDLAVAGMHVRASNTYGHTACGLSACDSIVAA